MQVCYCYIYLMAIVLEGNFWRLQKLLLSDEELFKIFWYLCIYFVQKGAELIAEKLIVSRREMPNPSLNIICTVFRFKYKTKSHFIDLVLASSCLDQELCQFLFFLIDVIFDKLSKLGEISRVISYYIETKGSWYLGQFFVNFFENCHKMRKNTNILIFSVKYFEEVVQTGTLFEFTFPNSSKQ